jgi:adenine C2-methylase RlmN of 23S rRNA A2503 and tRNA A37
MIEPSKPRAPYIVRHRTADQIESGKMLQASMEASDAESRRALAEENRLADEQLLIEQERASIEETRRAKSISGKLMDAKYGWVNNPTKG